MKKWELRECKPLAPERLAPVAKPGLSDGTLPPQTGASKLLLGNDSEAEF